MVVEIERTPTDYVVSQLGIVDFLLSPSTALMDSIMAAETMEDAAALCESALAGSVFLETQTLVGAVTRETNGAPDRMLLCNDATSNSTSAGVDFLVSQLYARRIY